MSQFNGRFGNVVCDIIKLNNFGVERFMRLQCNVFILYNEKIEV